MAESFALAASIISVIRFTLQIWTETSEIRKTDSTISVANCARDAASLRAHYEQVKSLQYAESDLAEAVSLNPFV